MEDVITCTFDEWVRNADAALSGRSISEVRLTTWPDIQVDPRIRDRVFVRLNGLKDWHLFYTLDVSEGENTWRAVVYTEVATTACTLALLEQQCPSVKSWHLPLDEPVIARAPDSP